MRLCCVKNTVWVYHFAVQLSRLHVKVEQGCGILAMEEYREVLQRGRKEYGELCERDGCQPRVEVWRGSST